MTTGRSAHPAGTVLTAEAGVMVAVVTQVPFACRKPQNITSGVNTATASTSHHPRGARSPGGFNLATRKAPCLCWLRFQNAFFSLQEPTRNAQGISCLCKSTVSSLKRLFHVFVFRGDDFLTPHQQPASSSDLQHTLTPAECTDPKGRTAKNYGGKENLRAFLPGTKVFHGLGGTHGDGRVPKAMGPPAPTTLEPCCQPAPAASHGMRDGIAAVHGHVC